MILQSFFPLILLVLETVKKQIKQPGPQDFPACVTSALKSCILSLLSVLLPEIRSFLVVLQVMGVRDLTDVDEPGLKVFTSSFIFSKCFVLVRVM